MAPGLRYSEDALTLKPKSKNKERLQKWDGARPDGKREESGANWGK